MEGKEDGEEKENEQDGNDRSPAQQYELYVLSDELNDKLKLLNYEEDYTNLAPTYRTVSREYFVKSTNIGEQFFIFTTLSAWLIQKAIDSAFTLPQEFDDPNGTISSILNALQSKDVPITFAPNELKTGAGEQCLYVLNKLADLALIARHFSWIKAYPVPEDDEEADKAVDQAEITAEEFDENGQIDDADDDDNEIVMDLKAMPSSRITGGKNQQPLDRILHSDTDVDSWKIEVERVAPRLKVTFEQDAKNWRMHLERIRSLQKTVAELLSTTEPHLKRISNELDKIMERIANRWKSVHALYHFKNFFVHQNFLYREKHFNIQLEPILIKFCLAKERMIEAKQKYKEISSGISERTQKLQRVSDELEHIKQQIDEKSLQNSDGAPMLRLKQALQKIESEILIMNVQISAIEQSLLQSQLKNRAVYNAYLRDLHI
ncbi:huntingtin-interacting protein-1 protein interactor [Loa loa]|uniref:Huntingtin-interacting protein-1 protein interactor n=2 Tax=Loa loa TaxID=7209 RepID=A0A1I7VDX1_LOALO|nr:huntingtin-interacting protein-1 protein interactor [Loa loa]EFO14185.2 huntingtin-interacting protein-1 protein interactor [Loa loa]